MTKLFLNVLMTGLCALFLASCATTGDTPEVIVILPEGEGEGDVGKIDFASQIKPILLGKCISCHHPNSEVTDISFASREDMLKASEERPILVPGEPEKSTLFLVTVLPDYFIEAMPASGHKLNETEKWDLYHWILQGAEWPEKDGILKMPAKSKKMVLQKRQESVLLGQRN